MAFTAQAAGRAGRLRWIRQSDGLEDPSWLDGVDGAVGVEGVVEPPLPPLPPLPSCPGQGSEAVGVLSAVNVPCGSMLFEAVGTLAPDELLAPVGLEPPDAVATVAQSAAAATTATTAHQTLSLRRLEPSVLIGLLLSVGVMGVG